MHTKQRMKKKKKKREIILCKLKAGKIQRGK